MLLSSGAQILAVDDDGDSMVHTAAFHDQTDVLEVQNSTTRLYTSFNFAKYFQSNLLYKQRRISPIAILQALTTSSHAWD